GAETREFAGSKVKRMPLPTKVLVAKRGQLRKKATELNQELEALKVGNTVSEQSLERIHTKLGELKPELQKLNDVIMEVLEHKEEILEAEFAEVSRYDDILCNIQAD